GNRHRQWALWRRHQPHERQLDHAGWRVSLPDLRQRRETGGLRHAAERVTQRDHQREDSLQQPAGPGGILIALDGPSTRELSPSGSPEGHAGSASDKELQRAEGVGRIVLSACEKGTRVMDIFQRAPLRIMFPRTTGAAVEEAVLINTAGGIAGGDRLQFDVTARPNADIAVTSQAAEKIYRALDEPARIATRLKACEAAKLAWLPQETIVFNRGRLSRETEIDVSSGAELLALEWL